MFDKDCMISQGSDALSFSVSNDTYNLKMSLDSSLTQLQIIVHQKKSFQVFQTTLTNQAFPPALLMYQDVETIFNYLSTDPENILSYNLPGKHLLFYDYVANQLTYHKIELKRRLLTPEEERQAKLQMIWAEKEQLQKKLVRQMREKEKSKQREAKLKEELRQMTKENQILKVRVKKHEEQIFRNETAFMVLQTKYALILKSANKQQYLFDTEKHQQGPEQQKKVPLEPVKLKQLEKEEAEEKIIEEATEKLPLRNFNQVQLKPQIQSTYSFALQDFVQFGAKLKYYITQQPHSSKFKITKSNRLIQKISPSNENSLLYLTLQDYIYRTRAKKRSKRVFLQLRNVSSPQVISDPTFNIRIGLMQKYGYIGQNIKDVSRSIYLDIINGHVYSNGSQMSIKTPQTFKSNDMIRIVIDYDLQMMAWSINEVLIKEIGSNLLKEQIFPFIQLTAEGSTIEIL